LAHGLLKRLNGLKFPYQDAAILLWMLRESVADTARALRRKTSQVEKRSQKAAEKLAKSLQKLTAKIAGERQVKGPDDSPPPALLTIGGHVFSEVMDVRTLMAAIPQAAPAEVEDEVLTGMKGVVAEGEEEPTGARDVAVVALGGSRSVFQGIGQRRRRNGWRINDTGLHGRLSGPARVLDDVVPSNPTKGFAEGIPRTRSTRSPMAATHSVPAALAQVSPKISAELFGLTNIWLAKLSLTPTQWKAVQPAHVPPVQSQNGRMQLRNPKASRSGLAGAIGHRLSVVQRHVGIRGTKVRKHWGGVIEAMEPLSTRSTVQSNRSRSI